MTTQAMTARLAVLAVGAAGLLQAGCSSMNNTEKGTLIGAGGGAAMGALIDKASGGKGGTGAVVGALGGGLVGGLMGNDADKHEKRQADVRQATMERAYQDDQPARIAEIVRLTRSGQEEGVILNHIKNNRMTFRLNADDLDTLKTNAVSPRVVAAMQNSAAPVVIASPPPKPMIVEREVIVERPVYIAPPPPPPAGVVFIGGSRRW